MKPKNDTPFNPLPLPENLNLASSAGTAEEQTTQSNPEPKLQRKRSAKRKSPKTKQSGGTASRADKESRWNRIKGRLAAKVALMDKEKLKAVLLACGVAAGIVAAVIVAIKLMPVAVLLLSILGLGVALKFWDRLRRSPCPF